MTRLVIIRHGCTEWNRVEKFRGRVDIPLNDSGIGQAEATAKYVADWNISVVYSSPLGRCMATANIIARQSNIEVKPLTDIIDIDFGKWQGLTPTQAEDHNSDLFSLWRSKPDLVNFPEGESLHNVSIRIERALRFITNMHHENTIALVSHNVICRVMVLNLLGMELSSFWRIQQDNCAVNLFQVDGYATHALKINDTCHLNNVT